MPSERDIKRRIKAVQNVGQITKAMKMVSAARIKKAEMNLKAARPYSLKLQEVVRDLISGMDEVLHPLMEVRPVKRTGILVVTSDKGLCGAYNNNLLKLVWPYVAKPEQRADCEIIVVGSKGDKFLKRRKVDPAVTKSPWAPTFELAQEVSDILYEWFTSGRVDEVLCFYSQAINAAVQKPAMERLLPLSKEEGEKPATDSNLVWEFEPGADKALDILLPRYLSNVVYRVLLEARVSELGARLKSMSNATDNAKKLASSLTLQYFRIRQENITKEILEIVGGAEALRASKG